MGAASAGRLLAASGCGLLAALALPPRGWWPLQVLAWAAAALLITGTSWRRRAALGFALGGAYFAVGLAWIVEFTSPGVVLAVAVSAVPVALALAVTPASGPWAVVALPSAVILGEALRDRVPLGGNPMAGWALGAANGPLAPAARIGGSLAVVWATVAAGAVLAAVLTVSWRRLAVAGAATIVAAVVAAGALDASATSRAGTVRVALVQGGGPVGTRAVTTNPDSVFQRGMTAAAGVQLPVGLVVWPESTLVSQVPFDQSKGGAMLAALASQFDATVVAGVEQRRGPAHARNLVVAYAPTGTVAAVYVKHHLVPFGEYVPARSLLRHVVDLRDTPFDTVAGSGTPVLATPAGRLGVMVSFEVFFDHAARSAARAGGLLVVPTDTASYRDPAVTGQELAACQLRALETGRNLVVVSPTGVSAVVDDGGAVVVRTRIGVAAVVERTVSMRHGLTVFDAVGSGPVVVAAAAALLAAWGYPARPRSPAPHSWKARMDRARPSGGARPTGSSRRRQAG